MFTGRVFIVGLATLGLPMAGFPADLSGAWLVQSNPSPRLSYTLLCVLKTNGGGVSGPCIATQGAILRTTGRLSDGGMRFKYSTDYNGSGVHLECGGRVQPDGTVSGTVDTGSSNGAFKATQLTRRSSAAQAARQHCPEKHLNLCTLIWDMLLNTQRSALRSS